MGPPRWEYEVIVSSPCEDTNCCLQNGPVASLPSQEQQEMASFCTQEVPGKGPLASLEGRCGTVTPSCCVSAWGQEQHLSLAAWGALSGVSC